MLGESVDKDESGRVVLGESVDGDKSGRAVMGESGRVVLGESVDGDKSGRAVLGALQSALDVVGNERDCLLQRVEVLESQTFATKEHQQKYMDNVIFLP